LVAAHRARLDWLLRIPQWSVGIERGLPALGLPGRRQGICLEAVIGALPLEHKHQLIRWVAAHFDQHLSRTVAQGICRITGVERFSEMDLENTLSLRQWHRLREAMLFRLAREHQRYKHAQSLLFINFDPLVRSLVASLVFDSNDRADCMQEGRLALLQAIDRVDTQGDFAAYAAAWIRRAARNHLLRQRLPVQAPTNLLSRALANRHNDTPAEPTAPSARLEAVLIEMLRHPCVALDAPPAAGDSPLCETLADTAASGPHTQAEQADLRRQVARSLEELTEKQREVVLQRYGLDGSPARTLAEIARHTGITHQQVSMRERRALRRLEGILASAVSEYHDTP